MKHTFLNRIAAFVLALAMLTGLVPSVAPRAEASTPLVYSFSRNTNVAAGDTDYANASGYVAMDQITEYGKNGSRKWKYLASKGFSSATVSNFGYGTGYIHWVGAEASETWVALEVYGIPSGCYDVAIRGIAGTTAPNFGKNMVYLFPADKVDYTSATTIKESVEKQIRDDNYLGTHNFYNTTNDNNSVIAKNVAISGDAEKKHVLVVRIPANGGTRTALYDITFTKTAELPSVTYSFARNTNVAAGDTSFASESGYVDISKVSAFGKGGTRKWRYIAQSGFVTTPSSNFGYGTNYSHMVGKWANESWVAFEVYGLNEGVYDLTIEGIATTAADKFGVNQVYFLPSSELDFSSESTLKSGIEKRLTNDYLVGEHNFCSTTKTAKLGSLTVRGDDSTRHVVVVRLPANKATSTALYYIRFDKTANLTNRVEYHFARNMTVPLGDTFFADVSDAYVLYDTVTEFGANDSRKWRYLAQEGFKTSAPSYMGIGTNYSHFVGVQTAEKWIALEVYGLEGGMYNVDIYGIAGTTGDKFGVNHVYLFPADKVDYTSANTIKSSVAANLTQENLIGTHDFYSTNKTGNLSKSFPIYGTAETKNVLVVRIPANQGTRTALYDMTFTRKPFEKKLGSIKADFGEVCIGNILSAEVEWLSTEGKELDGSTGSVELEVAENSSGALLTTDDGRIFTVAEGTSTVKVTGTLNNVTVSTDVEITVKSGKATSGVNTSYLFYAGGHSDTADTFFMVEGSFDDFVNKGGHLVTESEFAKYPYWDYGTHRPWAMVSAHIQRPGSASGYLYANNQYVDLSNLAGDWLAYKVKVPASGEYRVDISGNAYTRGGLLNVYMLPYSPDMTFSNVFENINSYISSADMIGQADFYNASVVNFRKNDVGKFIAEESEDYEKKGYKEYLLILKTAKSPISSDFVIRLGGIFLVGKNGASKVVNTFNEEANIGVGESISIADTKVYDASDSLTDLKDGYLYYRIAQEDKDIASFDPKTKTITALGEGEITLETVVILDGAVSVFKDNITVDNQNKIISAYLYSSGNTFVGKDVAFTVGLELANRKVIRRGEITGIEILSQSEENVFSLTSGGKAITANKAGTATVQATVLCRGVEFKTDVLTITAVEDEFGSNASFKIGLTSGAHTGDSFSNIMEATKYTQHRNWVFHDFVGGSGNPTALAANGQIVFKSPSNGGYLAFRAKFGVPGEYAVSSYAGRCRDRSGKIELYVMPANGENIANLASKLTTGNDFHVGSVDWYQAKESARADDIGSINILEKGEYLVVMKIVPGEASKKISSYGDAIYPNYFTFTNVNALESAEIIPESADEIIIGGTVATTLALYKPDGTRITADPTKLSVVYSSSDKSVATVDQQGNISGHAQGSAQITAQITYDGVSCTATYTAVVGDSTGVSAVEVTVPESLYIYQSSKLSAQAVMESGNVINIPDEYLEWSVSDAAVADLDGAMLTGLQTGTVYVQAKSTYKETELTSVPVKVEIVWDSTVNPAIYTVQKRENAKKNAARYGWAKDELDNITHQADVYVKNLDTIYNLLAPEGLPRYYHVGHKYDPNKYKCRYCGGDISVSVHMYGWTVDPINMPWKIQCPLCRRKFPSNDFGEFYKLGITETGAWSYEQALAENAKLVQADPENGGYLRNVLHPEMDELLGVKNWGVDDSRGYKQPYISDPKKPGYDSSYYNNGGSAWYNVGSDKGPVQHTYIAYYLHEGLWHGQGGMQNSGLVRNAMTTLGKAFAYTGKAEYGRAGAIILDRVADLYKDFDWYQWRSFRGDNYRGKIVDPVWETDMARELAYAYDAFLPIYNDPYVVNYLSEKGVKYRKEQDGSLTVVNAKDSPGALRKNVEENILLEIFDAVKHGEIYGNMGMHQYTLAAAALALNRMPETGEMLDWIMASGTGYNEGAGLREITGGNVMQNLINEVDRDGHGNEASPGYNSGWLDRLIGMADLLAGYEMYPQMDLFKNPKFLKMFAAQAYLTIGGYVTAQIGDTGSFASWGITQPEATGLIAFIHTRDPILPLAMKLRIDNNKKATSGIEDMHGRITDDDPEQVTRDIKRIIAEYEGFPLDSTLLAGYGFAALRAGGKYNAPVAKEAVNTNRDFDIYFGTGTGHGHLDALNLHVSAYGLNMGPDHGYPEQTGTQPNRYQWIRTTISHNTVVVNEKEQNALSKVGTPYHFDDSGKVKVMDVSADNAYFETDEYRRTVIMVDADDDISYGVDFFRVLGGKDHLYSFHSQSDELIAVSGLDDMRAQTDAEGNPVGSYAGANVNYGPDPGGNAPNNKYPLGYTWLKNVRTFDSVENEFSVEYKVKDWRNILPVKKDLRLRLTMVNDKPFDEVSFVTGLPAQGSSNRGIGDIEYLLVRNKGMDGLDSLFTTVYEPYEAERYIASIEKVPMVRNQGEKPGMNDAYSAVKVTHTNGRVDYVMYSTNTDVLYTVGEDENISFRGFAGVLSLEEVNGVKNVVYRYINDGDTLVYESEENPFASTPAAYTGTVADFTQDLSEENIVIFTPDEEIADASVLAGNFFYVENDGACNAAYKIEAASTLPNGDIKLEIGNVTLIRELLDKENPSAGYVFNIENGQSLRIPIAKTMDTSPVFAAQNDKQVVSGKKVTLNFSASSPSGKELSYEAVSLPRGAAFNAENSTVTWTPDANQVGKHAVAIKVTDGTLSAIQYVDIEVFKSSGSGSDESNPSAPSDGNQSSGDTGSSGSTGSGSASGGGAGSGGGSSSGGDASGNTGNTETGDNTGDTGNVGDNVIDVPSEKFIDLTNHTWAKDAIYALVEKGVINGTSESTYSPANNIKRADFAIMLVRAFGITEGEGTNFADVNASKYYAKELNLAKANGIVGGIGDNKFNPEGEITRQDMMLMLYRALIAKGHELDEADASALAQFSDAANIAEYAQGAVSSLVKGGYVAGSNGKINPLGKATRAEVAVLLGRIFMK